MGAWNRLRSAAWEARGAAVPLVAGLALWALLAAAGVHRPVPLHAGALLAAFGLAFSPWRRQPERVLLATLSVAHLGVASTAPEDPTFLVLLAAYAMLLCRALLELERFRRRAGERTAPDPVGWRTQLGLTSAVLGVAIALFVVVPRPSKPIEILVRANVDDRGFHGPHRSGLNEQPNLNEGSQVYLDSTPVAEVRLFDSSVPRGTTLRLRGKCFDVYQGGEWTRSSTADSPRGAGGDGWVQVASIDSADRTRLAHEVRYFSLSTRTILTLPEAASVEVPWLFTDGKGNLSLDHDPNGEIAYKVVSYALAKHPKGIDDLHIPSPEASLLRVPEGLDLVAQVARSAVGLETKPWGQAKQIQEMLETNFEYNLSPTPPAQGQDPVVAFLRNGSGYCVHFASAMALMLRSVGVPARLASGFLVREKDDTGKKYLVRNWDAHAWVEVPFPGIGWVAFDPSPIADTPPSSTAGTSGEEAPGGSSTPAGPAPPEKGVLSRVQGALASFGGEVQAHTWGGLLRVAWRTWPLLLVSLALGYLVKRFLSARRASAGASGSGRERREGGFFDLFVRLAARCGLRRAGNATPMEFAQRVEHALPGLDAPRLASLYYAVRFGHRALSPAETVEAKRILEDLRARA